MNLRDYFQQLAAYHAWATQRLLQEHVALVVDADYRRKVGLFFDSMHGTLNHLLVAETLWQARFIDGQSPALAMDAELETDAHTLAESLSTFSSRWSHWLGGINAPDLDGTLRYTRANGQILELPFAQTLGHVFNHATHHRGQMTAAMTAMGYASPELDWVRLLQLQSVC